MGGFRVERPMVANVPKLFNIAAGLVTAKSRRSGAAPCPEYSLDAIDDGFPLLGRWQDPRPRHDPSGSIWRGHTVTCSLS